MEKSCFVFVYMPLAALDRALGVAAFGPNESSAAFSGIALVATNGLGGMGVADVM